ncbi:plasmid recombination enzyme, partial [Salmonella enterica]|nr:plasmid recombination enzyme [Salmonella enterica]
KKYGAENIVTASIHRDETSPHLSAFVVPMTADGRLSAKEFIGNRSKMTADQTSFAKAVQHLGLERGIERSKATHTSIKQHYAAIERGIASGVTISPEAVEPKVLKKGIFTKEVESPGQVAERLTKAVKDAYQPMAANASVSAQERRRAKELQDTAKEQRNRLERLQEPFKGLSKEQVADVLALAMKHQKENTLAKEAKKQRAVEHQKERRESRSRGGFSR